MSALTCSVAVLILRLSSRYLYQLPLEMVHLVFFEFHDHWGLRMYSRLKQRRQENLRLSSECSIQMTLDCMSSAKKAISFSAECRYSAEKRISWNRKRKKKRRRPRQFAECTLGAFPSTVRQLIFPYSPQVASSLFLAHNTALVPPYRVLIDTNFINFSLQNKLELVSGMMDCLYAKCMH